jgi:hypothetical protein
MKFFVAFFFCFLGITPVLALSRAENPVSDSTDVRQNPLIEDLLRARPEKFRMILENSDKYELQILYTQIDRDDSNRPRFIRYGYRLNPKAYFNPASLVKLPVVCLAFQKLNVLDIKGLDKYSRLRIDQTGPCPTGIERDATSADGFPTIAHLAKKMLLVSDNLAYSQMFEFLGQVDINACLWAMGYRDALIIRRFCDCSYDDNRVTNPITFFNGEGKVLYHQDTSINPARFLHPLKPVLKGKAYMNERYQHVEGPYDYSESNSLNLTDAQDILKSVLFPEAVTEVRRFRLSGDDYRFLYRYLSMLPYESEYPDYKKRSDITDTIKKYFLFGDLNLHAGPLPLSSVRIFNMVGQSDGYVSDCAYVADFENRVEFMLSAVIYVNEDDVMRDGGYEYNSIGIPFLAELGRTVYDYEKKRTRSNPPDLRRFKMDY